MFTKQPDRWPIRRKHRRGLFLAGVATWLIIQTSSNPFATALQSPAPKPGAAGDLLFQSNEVITVHIGLAPEAIAGLNAERDAFVSGTFTYGTIVVRNVGVKIKGEASARHLDKKAAFKVAFDKFVPHQTFLGLTSLTLNNMIQDPSMIRETLAYELYRAAGVPAPRTGFANVYVNDQLYGLYLDVETEDRVFLAQAFADPSGNLYEGAYEVDLRTRDLAKLQQQEGTTNEDLTALVAAVDAHGESLFFGKAAPIDTPRFLQMLAVDTIIGHWDGYSGPNNYRLYHEPATQRWTVLPWGTDQTFHRDLAPLAGNGVLIGKCRASARCRADYLTEMARVLDVFAHAQLETSLDRVEALILPSIQADRRKESTDGASTRARASLRQFIHDRPARLRLQLAEFAKTH